MSNTTAKNDGVNRAKLYQLALFPLNNGATNVYFVLILSYVAQFGSSILQLGLYASLMVTIMRICDAITDPIIGALMDRTSTRWGKFRPFILFFSIPLLFLSVLTFYVPDAWKQEAWNGNIGPALLYAYLTYAVLGFLYSMVNIPYGSLASAMTQSPMLTITSSCSIRGRNSPGMRWPSTG